MILNVEDVFEDIPDSDDVLMKIPDEIIAQIMGISLDKVCDIMETNC